MDLGKLLSDLTSSIQRVASGSPEQSRLRQLLHKTADALEAELEQRAAPHNKTGPGKKTKAKQPK